MWGLTNRESRTWSARSTHGGGVAGLEIGFSSGLRSEGTVTTMNISSTEGSQTHFPAVGTPGRCPMAVFEISPRPIICVGTPVDGYHRRVKKFPVCFLRS